MNLAKWMLVAALAAGTAMAEDATKAFEVVKRTPVMAASATDVGEGEDVTVIVTLVDAEDATGTVFVYVGGDEYSAAVEDGAANVIVSELAPGYYSATVEYSGDDTYFGVSANVSFKVGRPQEEVDGVVWYYEPLEAGTAVVTGVAPNHATGNLTMPERLGGLTVTAVGGGAFHGCADLRSMAIPDSVTEIGSKAFKECTALTNVTLGAGVTNIGDNAFEGCTSLASVAFPEGLAGIEQGAFLGSGLTDAKLPDTTERIGEDVFAGCKALTNVWLGTGIESVGVFAFHLSTNLAAVWVPVEKAGTDLLAEARVPAGCEIHYYGTQVVTFDPNGGECGTATNGYTVGEAYGALPEARREGFAFDGWWDEAAGEEVAATNTVTEKAARTVVAHWSEPPVPPAVSNVVARQRWPWNGLVDVDYEVGGDTNLLAGLAAQITFTDSDGRSWVASTFLAGAEPWAEPGPHRATWNAAADAGAGVMASNAIATVSLVRAPEPRWCVIDLSGGSAASSYPVTYVTDVPNVPGGFNADAYKTTNLVLRLVKPSDWADGTFTMGGSCEATLTNAFWIGVFETTQRQWELVAGGRPSYFRRDDGYATRPVEKVSYEMIRGSDAGSMWPDSGDVDEDSFLGKLRARTGLAFDLPTEAQWEFACRATTTTDYNNGSDWTDGTSCTNLDPLGRYWFNGGGGGNGNPDCDTSGGTAAVGSYQPNEWGLYDCHGNVDEWCLDWFGDFAASAVEPVGAPSGEKRVLRGGCWIDNAVNCRSTGRIGLTPDFVGNYYGFRLCLPAVAETAAAAAASAAFRLDTREGPFESDGTETLTYSTLWHPERVASNGTNATVTILQNGDEDEPVASGLLDEGDAVWQVFEDGTYVLTHVTTTNVAVSPVCNEETATFVVRGHPLVEAALRWKYAKNANGWHCAQVALTWHPSYADEISDMRLLFADRYEDSEPLAVIKTLDDGQAAFFEVPEMIKLAGDDWKYYFLNDENGKVYSERFLEGGYREKLEERPTVSDGDEAGDVSGWAGGDSGKYIDEDGVLNGDGTAASFELTVNGTPMLQLKFASSPRGLGRRTAYLVDPATVVDPLGSMETYRDVEYRVAPVDLTAFAGLADGARAVYGVSDETMDSSLDSVPRAERLICLRVANRDYSTVGRADNKLAILAWKVGGLPRFLPIAETMSSLQDGGGVHQPAQQPAQQPAPRPLSVAEANLSAAFGLAPAAVARGAVTCRVSSMSFGEDGSVEGTFAVATENAGRVVAESGELAGNVKFTVLGAERLGGAFEPLDDSCGAELLSRKPPYAFRVKAPGKNAFFKIRLEADDLFE